MAQRHHQFRSYKEKLDHLLTDRVGTLYATKLFYAYYQFFGRRLVPLSEAAKEIYEINEREALYRYRTGEFRKQHLFVLEKRKDHPVVSLEAMVFFTLSEEMNEEEPDEE